MEYRKMYKKNFSNKIGEKKDKMKKYHSSLPKHYLSDNFLTSIPSFGL